MNKEEYTHVPPWGEPSYDKMLEILAGNQDAIAEAVASTTPEEKTEEGK